MEFWNSDKISSDDNDDDILQKIQNLDIGDNFMDDGEESETDGSGVDVTSNEKNIRDGDVDYPDDLSDMSDLFESDAHLLSLDMGQRVPESGVVNRETQMLSLDEVTYSRDLKWINTPEEDRPKPRISRSSNRFLKQVQGIANSNQGDLDELDRHYRSLDQKKKDFELSGPPGRDRRRGRTSGGLVENTSAPQPDPLVEGLAARGPGKLVVFDDDPKPSQRRKRPSRNGPPRSERGEDGRERRGRGESKDLRGDSTGKENRDKGGQYTQQSQPSRTNQGTNSNTSAASHPQSHSPRTQEHAQRHRHGGMRQDRQERQPRQEPTTVQSRNKPFAVQAVTLATKPPSTQPSASSLNRNAQQYIAENNAIKLRADAPAWIPSFAT
jgi:hypothetical protein